MTQIKGSNKDKHFTEDIKMPQKAWLLKVLQSESLGVFCSVNKGIFILANKGKSIHNKNFSPAITNAILRAVIKW